MNFRSFRPSLIAAAAFAALAFASAPAVAQTTTCSGCTVSPTTTPVAGIGLTISGGAATLGNLTGNYTGGLGNIVGQSLGTTDMRSTLNAATNGCPGGCGDLGATFSGLVTQQTGVQGVVQGNTGGPVTLTTGTGSATLLNVLITRP